MKLSPAFRTWLLTVGDRDPLGESQRAQAQLVKDLEHDAPLPAPVLRRLATHPETQLHTIADAHVSALSVAVRYAFAKGRKALGPNTGKVPHIGAAVAAVSEALHQVVPSTLTRIAIRGGAHAYDSIRLRTAGDIVGHDFHGNQWTGGRDTSSNPDDSRYVAALTELNPREFTSLAEIDAAIADQPVEYMIAMRDGKETLRKTQLERNSVGFEDADHASLRNAIVTHNHPEGSPLSTQDAYSATFHNEQEARAVGPLGTSVLTRIGSAWPKSLMETVYNINEHVRTEFEQDINAGRKTIQQAMDLHYDEVWKRVAHAEPGIQYQWLPRH